ncbi:MAG: hypothetical protein QCI38_08165 [Candidatus Thermoplasmatota archaeon]|nr:hypothetical protein [Candidatus Thermoplasmatota archaeon]
MAQDTLWGRMNGNQKLLSIVLLFTLITGGLAGGYQISSNKNNTLCLSCLALTYSGGDFTGEWWTTYPSTSPLAGQTVNHPGDVTSDLSRYDVVMVYFWQPGCTACDEQWEDMKEGGIVVGTEPSGQMSSKWSDVTLYSVDATKEPYNTWFRTYVQYKQHSPATPLTVFVANDGGNTVWYAQMGKMSARAVEGVLNDAL